MRSSVLASVAAMFLLMAGCNATPNSNETSQETQNDAAAVSVAEGKTGVDNGLAPTGTSVAGGKEAGSWEGFDDFLGKTASQSGLLETSAIAEPLHDLLGEKIAVLATNLETSSPLEKDGKILFTSGNKAHEGGSDAAYLLIEPEVKALEIGLWEKGQLNTYRTAGTKITKPKDMQTMLSDFEKQ